MKYLQEMKGKHTKVTGAYDHQKQHWTPEKQEEVTNYLAPRRSTSNPTTNITRSPSGAEDYDSDREKE